MYKEDMRKNLMKPKNNSMKPKKKIDKQHNNFSTNNKQ